MTAAVRVRVDLGAPLRRTAYHPRPSWHASTLPIRPDLAGLGRHRAAPRPRLVARVSAAAARRGLTVGVAVSLALAAAVLLGWVDPS